MRCISVVAALAAASSGASNQALRCASMAGISGQPGQAFAPWPRMEAWLAGFQWSTPDQKVKKPDHPPWSSGLRLARRATTVPQSVETSSTLNPMRRNRSAPTRVAALIEARSVALSSTSRAPIAPAACNSARAASTLFFSRSSPTVEAEGESGAK